MEEKEKKSGTGFFYGVIGVATLVVAIIGATFAYFTATAEDTNTIQGEAANTGLSLEVTHLSTGAVGGLIPLNTKKKKKAVTGDTAATGDPKTCLDSNNNSICQIYSIKVINEGNSIAAVTGTLDLQAVPYQGVDEEEEQESSFANLKWQVLTDSTTVNPGATSYGIGENPIASNVTLNAEGDQTFYVVIWIDNLNEAQNSADYGHFNGSVAFNSADGSGISATFSA